MKKTLLFILCATLLSGNLFSTDLVFFSGNTTVYDGGWDCWPKIASEPIAAASNVEFLLTSNEGRLPTSSDIKMDSKSYSLHFSYKNSWSATSVWQNWTAEVYNENTNWTSFDITDQNYLILNVYVGNGSMSKWAMPSIELVGSDDSWSAKVQMYDYVTISGEDFAPGNNWTQIAIPLSNFNLTTKQLKQIAFINDAMMGIQYDFYMGYIAFTSIIPTGINNTNANQSHAFVNNGRLNIISNESIKEVTLLDMTGKTISSHSNLTTNNFSMPLTSKGTYIVRTRTAEGYSTNKVVCL